MSQDTHQKAVDDYNKAVKEFNDVFFSVLTKDQQRAFDHVLPRLLATFKVVNKIEQGINPEFFDMGLPEAKAIRNTRTGSILTKCPNCDDNKQIEAAGNFTCEQCNLIYHVEEIEDRYMPLLPDYGDWW